MLQSWSDGGGRGVGRYRQGAQGNQIKMTLSEKYIIFSTVVTLNFIFSKGYELQFPSRLLKGEQK